MKTVLYGLPAHEYKPQDISDQQLLQEIVTLARIQYFINDPKSQPVPDRMRPHYGAILCDGEMQPLITEARQRSAAGSTECKIFFAAVDPILDRFGGRFGSDPRGDEYRFTNAAQHIIRDPVAQVYYGRVDPDQPVLVGRRAAATATPTPVPPK